MKKLIGWIGIICLFPIFSGLISVKDGTGFGAGFFAILLAEGMVIGVILLITFFIHLIDSD